MNLTPIIYQEDMKPGNSNTNFGKKYKTKKIIDLLSEHCYQWETKSCDNYISTLNSLVGNKVNVAKAHCSYMTNLHNLIERNLYMQFPPLKRYIKEINQIVEHYKDRLGGKERYIDRIKQVVKEAEDHLGKNIDISTYNFEHYIETVKDSKLA